MWIIIGLAIGALLFWYLHAENTSITMNRVELEFGDLPEEFDGFRIVHISDFHSASFGASSEQVRDKVKEESADLIAITGDQFDQRRRDMIPRGLRLLDMLPEIAPTYMVVGNHEWSTNVWDSKLQQQVLQRDVKVLRNSSVQLNRSGQVIYLAGMDDPQFLWHQGLNAELGLKRTLNGIKHSDFVILLSHRPELIKLYNAKRVDLVLSGHAHGGQIRLPFIGGVVAPQQGFFPKYTEGIHETEYSKLVISRGLGNSIIPQRLWNRPEIVVITIRKQKK